MAAYADLKDLLKVSIRWETKLQDFYDVAEFALANTESKSAVALLRENHQERLSVLKGIRVDDFGKSEWVRFARDYHDEDILPTKSVTRDSTPEEIVGAIQEYERKLRGYYAAVRDHVIGDGHKDLFESLVTFKDNQIADIDRLLA